MDRAKLEQAEQLRLSGQYEDAVALFESVLSDAADCAEAWWGLAHCTFNHLGDFEAAQEQFEKAVALEPTNARFLLDLGMYFTMLGMFEEARPILERILETSPDCKEATEARKQLSYL